VQAKVLITAQLNATTQQFQVGAGSNTLITLGKNLRAHVHLLNQRGSVEPLTRQVIEHTLQVRD
jgi:hypothetical protein